MIVLKGTSQGALKQASNKDRETSGFGNPYQDSVTRKQYDGVIRASQLSYVWPVCSGLRRLQV